MPELEETAAEIRRLVEGAVTESRLNPVTACLLYDRIMQVVAQSLAAAEERGRLGGLAGVRKTETQRGVEWWVPEATVEKHAAEPEDKRSWRTGKVGRPRKQREGEE